MMLSDQDIREVLKSGELVLEPFNEKMIRASGINLHLGETLLKPRPGKTVDVKTGIIPDFDEITIQENAPYALQPGEFLLGHTLQNVSVGRSLGLFIEGRSTLARVGLTIVQTAMLVYPGHRDRAITLEFANHGVNPILLYPRMKIARIALFELKTPCAVPYDDTGKYREQTRVGSPIFQNEFFEE
jgi:dCTP deaminase